jgi:hypothetical protein
MQAMKSGMIWRALASLVSKRTIQRWKLAGDALHAKAINWISLILCVQAINGTFCILLSFRYTFKPSQRFVGITPSVAWTIISQIGKRAIGEELMKLFLNKIGRKAFHLVGLEVHKDVPAERPIAYFRSNNYLQHTARKLEHLASLRIPVSGMTVLEVGAGVGDHSLYYIDRNCKITITEARSETLEYLRIRYPGYDIQFLDLEHPTPLPNSPFDIVHCCGVLYHLGNPEKALTYLSQVCAKVLFLETCVSFGDKKEINIVKEDETSLTQSYSGKGCRPTRIWLFDKLKELFEFVYVPKTQPNHEEFPLDWTNPQKHGNRLSRAVFIASRERIDNPILSSSLLDHQIRHE